jgi:hypothetical protein
MSFFDSSGCCIPTKECRVFENGTVRYYDIKKPEINFTRILEKSKKFNLVSEEINEKDFKIKAENLIDVINNDSNYKNILNGVKIPFIFQKIGKVSDLGNELEHVLLPKINHSFTEEYPDCYFKAVLQSNSKLSSKIKISPDSNYEKLIELGNEDFVVGWYFPQAFQGYDIQSQRKRIKSLPDLVGVNKCLSGGIDICASIIGVPSLLISKDTYAPILCMSSYMHDDPRLVLLLKSYGPHLEFWCMTQMLTKDVTQVSEQWSGGISIFI